MSKYTVHTTPEFEHEFKKLLKKYPKIIDDYDELVEEIENESNLGKDIPGVIKDGNKVFKKRMKNSSANKGLSGGFRIIEYLVTESNDIYLIDIYSKSDQVNISKKKILKLIRENEHYFIHSRP